IFTFVAVWAQPLVVLQLATIWGTVGLMALIFGKQRRTGTDSAGGRQEAESSGSSEAFIQVPPTASTAAPRATRASVEHLIGELLSSPGLRDDTRVELNSYLLQRRSGRLHP